jgi:hypothetical protein
MVQWWVPLFKRTLLLLENKSNETIIPRYPKALLPELRILGEGKIESGVSK